MLMHPALKGKQMIRKKKSLSGKKTIRRTEVEETEREVSVPTWPHNGLSAWTMPILTAVL